MKPNTERLRKLADHLLNGKLGHERFDFSLYNSADDNTCGTAGCAMGECPILWPEDWAFDQVGFPYYLKGMEVEDRLVSDSGTEYFDISEDAYAHLFIPKSQNVDDFGGVYLYSDATKEQVANNILEFCKRYD